MVGEESRSFTGGLLRRDNRAGVRQRLQLRQSILAGGRDREVRHDRDDAIEL